MQQAVKLIIEPIFEADFKSFSYGYRPGRSAKEASREIYKYINFGISGIIDLDIKGFFDHFDHDIMISKVMDRIADGYVIKLIREWIRGASSSSGTRVIPWRALLRVVSYLHCLQTYT